MTCGDLRQLSFQGYVKFANEANKFEQVIASYIFTYCLSAIALKQTSANGKSTRQDISITLLETSLILLRVDNMQLKFLDSQRG